MSLARLRDSRVTQGALLGALMALSGEAVAAMQSGTTVRISESAQGAQGNGVSSMNYGGCTFSPDGRWVSFFSTSNNLVPSSGAPGYDVFVRDLWSGTVEMVSVGNAGNAANSDSLPGYVSTDGRFVYFGSTASNLVDGDTNNHYDIFVRDRLLATTTRISLAWNGSQAGVGTGAFRVAASVAKLAFESESTNLVPGDANGVSDVFVRDIAAGNTSRVSVNSVGVEGNGPSIEADVNADGSLIVFSSAASNLVAGDNNGTTDIFLHDTNTQQTDRLSISSSGAEADLPSETPCISANGRFVAFGSSATNLVAGDTNNRRDIFVRDLLAATTARVNVSNAGAQANDSSGLPTISSDGRRIAFWSVATNLVSGTSSVEIFLRDTLQNKTFLISQSTAGVQGNGSSGKASICANGRQVVFESAADNLVPGDTNNLPDVFVRDVDPTPPIVYCPPKTNSAGCIPSVTTTGSVSASSPAPFWIDASPVLNNKAGLVFYSTTSSTLLAFQAGWLCVAPPIRRTSVMLSGGSPPPALDCSGLYHFDFNAWIQSGIDPALIAGQSVWAQFWSRDPGYAFPNNTGLTNAVAFEIGP